jgi:hypothetical protein
VGAQRLRVRLVPRTPDLLEQRVVGQESTTMTDQDAQQLEFDRSQVDLLAVAAHDVRCEIDLEAVQRHAGLVVAAMSSPQGRMQACDQLARSERLGQLAVRAGVERAHLVLLVADRREHD